MRLTITKYRDILTMKATFRNLSPFSREVGLGGPDISRLSAFTVLCHHRSCDRIRSDSDVICFVGITCWNCTTRSPSFRKSCLRGCRMSSHCSQSCTHSHQMKIIHGQKLSALHSSSCAANKCTTLLCTSH